MKPIEYLLNEDMGASSKTILAVMKNIDPKKPATPQDPSDFDRCYRLLEEFPKWRERLVEMCCIPQWRPFVREWVALETLYRKALKTCDGHLLYQEIRKLNEEGRQHV